MIVSDELVLLTVIMRENKDSSHRNIWIRVTMNWWLIDVLSWTTGYLANAGVNVKDTREKGIVKVSLGIFKTQCTIDIDSIDDIDIDSPLSKT